MGDLVKTAIFKRSWKLVSEDGFLGQFREDKGTLHLADLHLVEQVSGIANRPRQGKVNRSPLPTSIRTWSNRNTPPTGLQTNQTIEGSRDAYRASTITSSC